MEQISAFVAYQTASADEKIKPSKSNTSKQKKASNKKKAMNATHGETLQNARKRKSSSDIGETASPTETPSFVGGSATLSQDTTVSSSQNSKRSNRQSNSVGDQPGTSGTQKSRNKRQNTSQRAMSGGNRSAASIGGRLPADVIQMAATSSINIGAKYFSKLIGGIHQDEFMTKYWQRKPVHISRKSDIYHSLNISMASIDEMLRSNVIEYTKNLDITSYVDGKRETHNPDGRAMPGTVWDYYNDGYSVRFLNPQTFHATLHQLIATLQEYFHCLVGANIYLTPPKSQGFAPHYDDIEAFVLQIEGKKRWRIYQPGSEAEKLPRESSGNFTESDVKGMKLALEVILEPGDLLYFPRGWIHQANTVAGHHSLHITLSAYQKTSFADLFEGMMKETLAKAIATEASFRYGLPLDIWYNFGASYQNLLTERKIEIKEHIKTLFDRLINHIDLDEAVDRLAVKFQHDALPPFMAEGEKKLTSIGTQAFPKTNGEMMVRVLQENTAIRLLRANIVRLTIHDSELRLYYYSDNSKEYHQNEVNYIELDECAVSIVNKLIDSYPIYRQIRDLDDDSENALVIIRALWERGLLMTNTPL